MSKCWEHLSMGVIMRESKCFLHRITSLSMKVRSQVTATRPNYSLTSSSSASLLTAYNYTKHIIHVTNHKPNQLTQVLHVILNHPTAQDSQGRRHVASHWHPKLTTIHLPTELVKGVCTVKPAQYHLHQPCKVYIDSVISMVFSPFNKTTMIRHVQP